MLRHATITLALWCAIPAGYAFDLDGLKSRVGELRQEVTAANGAPAQGPSGGLSAFTIEQQITSLKQALGQGADTAVAQLAKENGYLGNDRVRIPLPENLQKVDGALRRVGLGRYADELITGMNRAAEAAVPEAKAMFIAAIKNMTFADAKAILTGGDDSATRYFRSSTEPALTAKFKPIVDHSMQHVQVAQTYDRFAGKGAQLGLMDERNAHLDDYITRKAMDGLFLMMADQEKEIRAHPLQATGDLAKKVFAALK